MGHAATHVVLKFPNAVVLNAVGRRKRANEREIFVENR